MTKFHHEIEWFDNVFEDEVEIEWNLFFSRMCSIKNAKGIVSMMEKNSNILGGICKHLRTIPSKQALATTFH